MILTKISFQPESKYFTDGTYFTPRHYAPNDQIREEHEEKNLNSLDRINRMYRIGKAEVTESMEGSLNG